MTKDNGVSAGPTSGTNRSALPLLLTALAVAGFLIAIFLGMAVPDQDALGLVFPVVGLSYSLIGSIIARRRQENAIGWLILGTGMLLLIQALAQFVAVLAVDESFPLHHLADEAAWADLWLWVPGFALIAIVLFLFPTGRPPTPRWNWFLWLAGTMLAALLIAVAEIWPRRTTEFIGAEGTIGEVSGSRLLDLVANWGFAVLLVLALAALTFRFFKGSQHVRQQLKWLVWGTGTAWFLAIVTALTSSVAPIENPLYLAFLFVAVMSFPISVAIAILRYRLFDIDRIISRTVSYALVVGVLGLVVLGLVSLLATFLPSDDPLVVAVSTLAAAALFNPVRRRVQSVIDRRFNRSRYDAQRVVGSFTETLQEQVDPDEVIDGWVVVVTETMQPSAVAAWVRR